MATGSANVKVDSSFELLRVNSQHGYRTWNAQQVLDFHRDHNSIIDPDLGCYLFQQKTANGYISIRFKGGRVSLHRLALETRLGRPLRPGMESLHRDYPKCPRNCFRPEHLVEGTHQENMQSLKNRSRLSKSQLNELYTLWTTTKMKKKDIADRFGITYRSARRLMARIDEIEPWL